MSDSRLSHEADCHREQIATESRLPQRADCHMKQTTTENKLPHGRAHGRTEVRIRDEKIARRWPWKRRKKVADGERRDADGDE